MNNKSNGISLKNDYSTVDIKYYSINDSKFKKIDLTNNSLNIENNKNLILKNESKNSINNITVYSQTFKSKNNIIQIWNFQDDKFGYLITVTMSSKTYNSEKHELIEVNVKNMISSLTPVEYE